jgi:ribosomal-protein-alanine N-acetyltransferase
VKGKTSEKAESVNGRGQRGTRAAASAAYLNTALELTAHIAGFVGYPWHFLLWAAAQRKRSAPHQVSLVNRDNVMTHMPPLETPRLVIRPFSPDDLHPIHRILDVELREAELGTTGVQTLHERAQWLQWTMLNYTQLAQLYQPPYGERAVVHTYTGHLIGACGFVPCLDAFEQFPAFSAALTPSPHRLSTPEFGLFYAIAPTFQGQGYATEAARALVHYAFEHLRLKRVVATTTHENGASIGVMRKLGMRIERNPYTEPPWLQVVGILVNPAASEAQGGSGA